jgi:hypothetical protein
MFVVEIARYWSKVMIVLAESLVRSCVEGRFPGQNLFNLCYFTVVVMYGKKSGNPRLGASFKLRSKQTPKRRHAHGPDGC